VGIAVTKRLKHLKCRAACHIAHRGGGLANTSSSEVEIEERWIRAVRDVGVDLCKQVVEENSIPHSRRKHFRVQPIEHIRRIAVTVHDRGESRDVYQSDKWVI